MSTFNKPLRITLGAALFLRERLGPRRVFGVCIALIGAMIIIRPGAASFSPWALLPFAGALCYATNALITRRVGQRESVWTAVLNLCEELGYAGGDLDPKIPLANVTLCRLTGKFATGSCREHGHAYETAIPYELAPKAECPGHEAVVRRSR